MCVWPMAPLTTDRDEADEGYTTPSKLASLIRQLTETKLTKAACFFGARRSDSSSPNGTKRRVTSSSVTASGMFAM